MDVVEAQDTLERFVERDGRLERELVDVERVSLVSDVVWIDRFGFRDETMLVVDRELAEDVNRFDPTVLLRVPSRTSSFVPGSMRSVTSMRCQWMSRHRSSVSGDRFR